MPAKVPAAPFTNLAKSSNILLSACILLPRLSPPRPAPPPRHPPPVSYGWPGGGAGRGRGHHSSTWVAEDGDPRVSASGLSPWMPNVSIPPTQRQPPSSTICPAPPPPTPPPTHTPPNP